LRSTAIVAVASLLSCAHAQEADVPEPAASAERVDVAHERAALDRRNGKSQQDGRALHKQLRAGAVEALHARFSSAMLDALPLDAWRSAHAQIVGLGDEIELIDEVTIAIGRLSIYSRRVRVEKMEPEFEEKWIFDEGGVIHSFSFTQAPPAAPTEHLGRSPKTRLSPPFVGTWYVVWGGPGIARNYHVVAADQRFAYDLLVTKEGMSFSGDGTRNEDYYAFGREVLSPGDGVVLDAADGVVDNPPGEMNPKQPLGNYVVVSHENGEYSVLAHFQRGSVRVKVGDRLERGQPVGLCGNSGNTTEPHIHFHVQTSSKPFEGAGLPVRFERAAVDGVAQQDVEPVGGQLLTAATE
jgi:murein DD-endopeptidase MepM/ murein hydrolase activator NlpD